MKKIRVFRILNKLDKFLESLPGNVNLGLS